MLAPDNPLIPVGPGTAAGFLAGVVEAGPRSLHNSASDVYDVRQLTATGPRGVLARPAGARAREV